MSERRSPGAGDARRPPLEAVLLDAGGVLVRLDFEWMAETLAALGANITAASLRRAEVSGRRRYDASRGHPPRPGEPHPALGSRGDTDAYFAGTLDAAGVSETIRPEALARFRARQAATGIWGRANEGARETLDALARLGLRRAVVSNSDGRAERHLIDCGVRDGLEFVIDSQVVGVEKPDPRIFRMALDRLGVPAERTLFVGDIRCVDEDGARAAGLHFVLIDPYGDYAAAGTATLTDIGALPHHLTSRFTLAPSAPTGAAEGGASGDRPGGRS